VPEFVAHVEFVERDVQTSGHGFGVLLTTDGKPFRM